MREVGKGTLVDRAIRLIEGLADGSIDRLVPVLDAESPSAYVYPEALEVLAVERGAEAAILRSLADKGILDTEPVATVPVCPFCLTYPMRVERYCDACGSTAVHRTTMIHHFRCGNVSVEETYQQGDSLVCPKCERALRHIGVDYERPSRVWLCDDCGKVMSQPELRYHSLTCGRKVPIDDVLDRQVVAYSLSGDGRTLATEGRVRAAIEGPDDRDALTGLAGAGAFARQLDLEQQRAQRYQTLFSLVRVQLANGAELREKYGEAAVGEVIATLATIVHENLRSVDIVARSATFLIEALLPETDEDRAEVAAVKLRDASLAYLRAEGRSGAHAEAEVEIEVVDMTTLAADDTSAESA